MNKYFSKRCWNGKGYYSSQAIMGVVWSQHYVSTMFLFLAIFSIFHAENIILTHT
jgi:hypothetical protein